jgi:hypothetical protein
MSRHYWPDTGPSRSWVRWLDRLAWSIPLATLLYLAWHLDRAGVI